MFGHLCFQLDWLLQSVSVLSAILAYCYSKTVWLYSFYKKDLKLEVENVKITIVLAPRNSQSRSIFLASYNYKFIISKSNFIPISSLASSSSVPLLPFSLLI